MKNSMMCIVAGVALLVTAGRVEAAPISVSDSALNTVDGQLHQFVLGALPSSDGAGGQFSITLSGDYSDRLYPPLSEGATVTLDIAGGSLDLYNQSGGNGVGSNTIAGLTLASTSKSGGGNDFTLGWVFNLNGALLNTILANNSIEIDVQNSSDVDAAFGGYVQVGVQYESGTAPVPEPGTFVLFGAAALGAYVIRRRRKAS